MRLIHRPDYRKRLCYPKLNLALSYLVVHRSCKVKQDCEIQLALNQRPPINTNLERKPSLERISSMFGITSKVAVGTLAPLGWTSRITDQKCEMRGRGVFTEPGHPVLTAEQITFLL